MDRLYRPTHIASLAFFRIQEHVRKSLPALVDKKVGFSPSHYNCNIIEYSYGVVGDFEIFEENNLNSNT